MSTPSLAMIPSGRKAGKVYSVLPTDGTGDFDFSRATTATRINKDGLIETVGSNIPRLNYPLIDGVVSGCPSLLLEPSRTNLIPSNVSDWVVFQSNVTQSNQSPDGYNNAIKITSNAVVNSGVYFSGLSVSGNTEIFTIWLKGENGGEILEIGDATNRTTVTLTNEWVRYEAKAISASTFKILYNQTTNPIVQTWYAWGPQLEDNVSYATSYIPTQGSSVTRVAESCNGAGDANTFNDNEGVLFAEISALANDGTFRFISLSDGTSSNRLSLFFSTSNTLNAGGLGITSIGGVSGIENNNKVAFKYKSGDYALWVNGIEVGTSTVTTGNHANLNRLNFDFGQGSDDFYGNVKQIQYFNTALTDQELQQLTTL